MTKTPKKHAVSEDTEGMFSSLSPVTRDLLCVVFLYVVTIVLFRGIIFNDAAFASGGDTANALSYAHAGITLSEKEHTDVLWMPYFFSGMPTFGPVAFIPRNVDYIQTYAQTLLNFLYLNGQWTWYIVYFLIGGVSMFFLLRVFKLSRPAALIGALTFMLSPFAMGLPAEGHGSKLMALSYLPLVFMLTHLLFERRDLLSFGLLAASIGTLLLTNHMQIAYYVFMVVGLYLVYTIAVDFPDRKLLAARKTALLAGALILGLCISLYVYLPVYEYAQYSMRGGGTAGATGGLAFDYATNWSWSIWEAIVLLIPGFYGISGPQSPYYWGHVEPWTNSNVYAGLLPIILAVLAVRFRRTRFTMFLLVLTGIVLLISLGRNFPFVYEFLFSFLPFFNKFRAPSMILHLLPFTLGFLGAVGYEAIVDLHNAKGKETHSAVRVLAYIAGGAGAVFLLSLLLKTSLQDFLSSFMFLKDNEVAELQRQYGARAQYAVAQITGMRFDIFWRDFLIFLLLLAAGTGAIALYLRRTLSGRSFNAVLIALVLIDLFIVDSRRITPYPANAVEQSFRMDSTISFLKEQPGLFRIFPLGDLFMDNTYAYFGLQSVGGYSPAKLKIYQTMLDSCMYHSPDPSLPLNMNVVDMLNVRYLLAKFRLPADRFQLVHVDDSRKILTYENPAALPRAFFVDTVLAARDDHEVFATLNSSTFDPAKAAVVHAPFDAKVARPDSTKVDITSYESRVIAIEAYTAAPALLVLSEVYYPAGWKATVDGNPTPIYRTDDILRSVVVPAGKHTIEFRYAPATYMAGWITSNTAWVIVALLLLLGLWRTPAIRRLIPMSAPKGGEQKGTS